jgi:hypothetical protein
MGQFELLEMILKSTRMSWRTPSLDRGCGTKGTTTQCAVQQAFIAQALA